MRAKKFFKISALVLLITIVVSVGVFTAANAIFGAKSLDYAASIQKVEKEEVLEPFRDAETGYVTFETDRDFKILQLTDIHIGGSLTSYAADRRAIDAVVKLVKHTKPDLIIVTGDSVYPTLNSVSLNNMREMKIFGQTMQSLGVYWTFTFGNHDTEVYSFYNRKDISEYLESLSYCLFESGPSDVDGYGNTVINIQNSSKVITQALFLLDSHAYQKGFYRQYDNIHANQVEWYEKEVKRLDAINIARGAAESLKSLAFFHIPLVEYRTAIDEYHANGDKDTENVKHIYGVHDEKISCGVGHDDLFEVMIKLESTQGIFCGHDHVNNYSLDYNGGAGDYYIRLTYSLSIDYWAYPGITKKTQQRGGTVIYTKPNGEFTHMPLRLVDIA